MQGAPPTVNSVAPSSVHAQIQQLHPVHWLHPRAVMLTTLYASLTADPRIRCNIPPRLKELLEFHRSLIVWENEDDATAEEDAAQEEVRVAWQLHCPPTQQSMAMQRQYCLQHTPDVCLACRVPPHPNLHALLLFLRDQPEPLWSPAVCHAHTLILHVMAAKGT